MGFAIRSQTIQRLREPLVPTGSSDRRFDRSSSLSALVPWHPRVVQTATSWCRPPFHASSWPIPVRPSRCSITAETTRWFDRQKIEFDNRPQGPPPWRCPVDCPAAHPSQPPYSTWSSVSAAIVSFQHRILLRRSAGRRMRMTGAPSACMAGSVPDVRRRSWVFC